MCDQNHISRYRLPGDQNVVRSNRRTLGRQESSNLTGLSGIFLVELQHRKLESIHQRYILRRPPALERTIEQLVRYDCRNS